MEDTQNAQGNNSGLTYSGKDDLESQAKIKSYPHHLIPL